MSAPALATPAIRTRLAPAWHTAVYLVFLTCLSLIGMRGLPHLGFSPRITSYVFIIGIEWLLVAWVASARRWGGASISILIGQRWTRPSAFLRDLGISVVFLAGSIFVTSTLGQLLGARLNARTLQLLPQTRAEMAVWIFVALTAGICEELTTRGYLQQQLGGLLRNRSAAIVGQAVIFGAAHLYQGWRLALTIAVLGGMMGVLAQWRRSLLPGMLAHFLQDVLGGLLHGGH
jgi:uncharacterized protein